MSTFTMDMTSYKVPSKTIESTEYGDEILSAGWIPSLALQQSLNFENSALIPDDLLNVDAETFLRKMYAWQR